MKKDLTILNSKIFLSKHNFLLTNTYRSMYLYYIPGIWKYDYSFQNITKRFES